jgi:hypothetical protein
MVNQQSGIAYARTIDPFKFLGKEGQDWHSCPGDVYGDVLMRPRRGVAPELSVREPFALPWGLNPKI